MRRKRHAIVISWGVSCSALLNEGGIQLHGRGFWFCDLRRRDEDASLEGPWWRLPYAVSRRTQTLSAEP